MKTAMNTAKHISTVRAKAEEEEHIKKLKKLIKHVFKVRSYESKSLKHKLPNISNQADLSHLSLSSDTV